MHYIHFSGFQIALHFLAQGAVDLEFRANHKVLFGDHGPGDRWISWLVSFANLPNAAQVSHGIRYFILHFFGVYDFIQLVHSDPTTFIAKSRFATFFFFFHVKSMIFLESTLVVS